MKNAIFYHPHPLSENPTKGSELRPRKMKQAFENIGYDVDLVVGDSLKRKESMSAIENKLIKGVSYEFLYAESSNMPIPLADSHHIPLRPLLDFKFFRFLNKKNIPIGFFYRDLYWRVEEIKKEIPYLKSIFHWLEWFGVVKTVDHLFLPTTKMRKYFPTKWSKKKLSALLPGCDLNSSSKKDEIFKNYSNNNELTLFYVGGVKPPYYDLSPLFRVINELSGVKMILCCQRKNWNQNSSYYEGFNFDNVEIVHANSTQIAKYYNQADIFFDVRKPEGYLKNTIPIKVVESIGYEVPLLLLSGTEPAAFVRKQNAGWVVDSLNEAKELLLSLAEEKSKIKSKVQSLKRIKQNHTWEARAKEAGNILTDQKLNG